MAMKFTSIEAVTFEAGELAKVVRFIGDDDDRTEYEFMVRLSALPVVIAVAPLGEIDISVRDEEGDDLAQWEADGCPDESNMAHWDSDGLGER